MMTGYGDVLESTNRNQSQQSSQISHHQTSDFNLPTSNGTQKAPNHQQKQTSDCLLPNKSVPYAFNYNVSKTNFTSAFEHTSQVSPRYTTASNSSPRLNAYSSFQPISSNFALPKFNQVSSQFGEASTSNAQNGRITPVETLLDSPRSTVSKTSLPESNSELVLGALKTLLDKLKDLEIERDKAKKEIEKLDKERQWLALNQTRENIEQENLRSNFQDKPVMYEAAVNTSDIELLSQRKVDFSNQVAGSSSVSELRSEHNSVHLAQTMSNANLYPRTTHDENYDRSMVNTGTTYSYNSNTAPISVGRAVNMPFESSRGLFQRSASNYPILTGTSGTRSGSLSSHHPDYNDYLTSLTPATSGYNADLGTARTFTREELYERSPVSGYITRTEVAPRKSGDYSFDGPQTAKSYSFTTGAFQGLGGSNLRPSGYVGKSITVPPMANSDDLGFNGFPNERPRETFQNGSPIERFQNERSRDIFGGERSSKQNFANERSRDLHVNGKSKEFDTYAERSRDLRNDASAGITPQTLEVEYEDEESGSSSGEDDDENGDGVDVDGNDGNRRDSQLERSFSELQNSTQVCFDCCGYSANIQ